MVSISAFRGVLWKELFPPNHVTPEMTFLDRGFHFRSSAIEKLGPTPMLTEFMIGWIPDERINLERDPNIIYSFLVDFAS